MTRIKVGVLRGGPSSEYEISLKTGENVIKHLPKRKYEIRDILLTRDGAWHENGIPKKPEKIIRNHDVIFNALHGEYGEDGGVQQLLEKYKARYTGSEAFASAIAMRKHLAREVFEKAGLKIPKGLVVKRGDKVASVTSEIKEKLFPWWVVKPASAGSSVGVSISKSLKEIEASLKNAFKFGNKALVEEHLDGREATCAVIENFRGEHYYALPVIEIIPPPGTFFNYDNKYSGKTREICPGRFGRETSEEIKKAALLAHKILGCRHYSRSDFIVTKRGVFTLETNTLPGLTSESLLPKAASEAGLQFDRLLDHIVSLAV